MLQGMSWCKVCTGTAITVCSELLEQQQERDSNITQVVSYLKEGNGAEDKHQPGKWRKGPPPPLPKHCSGPHVPGASAKRNQQHLPGEGICSKCPAQMNRNGGAP